VVGVLDAIVASVFLFLSFEVRVIKRFVMIFSWLWRLRRRWDGVWLRVGLNVGLYVLSGIIQGVNSSPLKSENSYLVRS